MKIMRLGLLISIGFLFFFSTSKFIIAETVDSGTEVVDSKKTETAYRLEEVIVRDHPLKDETMVVTPDVTIINIDKFKKPGRMENVTDVIGEVLGVNVLHSSTTPAQNEGVYIRGMDQSRYQVFMDGRPMRLHGSNGYFKMDWTTMPLSNVETIEIIRGSHSLLFPFSMGGAINIITKKGKKTDDPTPHGTVKTGFGPYGDQSYSANLTGGAFNLIGYSLAAAHREGDGYLRGNDYDTDNLNGRFSFFLPTGGTVTYGIDWVDTVTGYAVINDPDDPASNYDPDYPIVRLNEVDTFSHDYEGTAYAGGKNQWERTVIDHSLLIEQPLGVGKVRGQIYQQTSERSRYRHTATGQDNSNYKEEYTGGISLDYLGFNLIDNHCFSIGGDYRNQGTDDNRDFYEITSIFIKDVWAINNAVYLTFGTRWYEFISDGYAAITLEPAKHKEKEWCPKARLDYDFDDTTSFYASVSREMRMP